jgi:hypothetical protein
MTDAVIVVGPELVAVEARAEGSERETEQVDEQLTVDAYTSAMIQDVIGPSAKWPSFVRPRPGMLRWFRAVPEVSIAVRCVAC